MTIGYLCELLDRIVSEPDLYLRVQRAREVRLVLAPLVVPPVALPDPHPTREAPE